MLHCFHGFLGSTQDFSAIDNAKPYNLYDCIESSKEEMFLTLSKHIPSGESLMGYSLGGRLAMQIFLQSPDKYKKCFVLSSHCGLKDKSSKMKRVLFDQKCAQKVRDLSEEDFLKGWNAQAVFKHDQAIERFPTQDREKLSRCFTEYGLSTQDYLLENLLKYKDKVVFIYGEQDEKYRDYALKVIRPHGFKTYILENTGHRLLQTRSKSINQIVREND